MQVVRESVEGRIAYNIPSNHHGFVFSDIALAFEHGKVTEIEANDTERMEAIKRAKREAMAKRKRDACRRG